MTHAKSTLIISGDLAKVVDDLQAAGKLTPEAMNNAVCAALARAHAEGKAEGLRQAADEALAAAHRIAEGMTSMAGKACATGALIAFDAKLRSLIHLPAGEERPAAEAALRAELESVREAWRQSVDNANRAWAAVEACEAKRRSDV